MAQGDYIELSQKRHGRRLDHEERKRKKEARSGHMNSAINKKVRGLKAKQFNKKRYAEKAEMKKKIKQHAERLNKHQTAEAPDDKEAVPAYLLDREGMSHAKVLSNSIKQKRKEKAGKPDDRTLAHTPIPKFPPPHAFTTPSPHGPFIASPALLDAKVADWSDRTKAESAFVRSYQPSTCCQMCMPFWHDTSRASHLARQGWAGNSKNCAVDHLGRRGVEATRPIANGTTSVIAVPPVKCPIHRQPHDVPSQPICNHRRAS